MGSKVKKIFSKIISLSYPKYRFFTLAGVILILAIIPINYLESMPNLSICSRVLGKYCYSVGITRGVSSLLKGKILQAIDYNILAILVLIIMFGIIIYDLRGILKNRTQYKPKLF